MFWSFVYDQTVGRAAYLKTRFYPASVMSEI